MMGMTGQNHPSRVKKRGAIDSVDDRETPPDVFDPLHAEFQFTLDVAAARHNAKVPRYYALGDTPTHVDPNQLAMFPDIYVGDEHALAINGLSQKWDRGERIWCNPPFSDIEPWVLKSTYCAATVVMLVPANRTEQPWWQRFIEPLRDGRDGFHRKDSPQTRFLAGRRCFRNRGQAITNRTSRNPPFGIAIIIWDRREKVS